MDPTQIDVGCLVFRVAFVVLEQSKDPVSKRASAQIRGSSLVYSEVQYLHAFMIFFYPRCLSGAGPPLIAG